MVDIDQLLQQIKIEDREVSRRAARALAKSGDERALNSLLEYLDDKSRRDRGGVAYSLYRFPPDLILEPLLRALSDEEWDLRDGAYHTLARLKETRAIPAIIALLKSVANGEVKEETFSDGVTNDYTLYVLIEVIGQMCESVGVPSLFQEAIEPLRHFLQDPRALARRNAARSLRQLGEAV